MLVTTIVVVVNDIRNNINFQVRFSQRVSQIKRQVMLTCERVRQLGEVRHRWSVWGSPCQAASCMLCVLAHTHLSCFCSESHSANDAAVNGLIFAPVLLQLRYGITAFIPVTSRDSIG